MPDDRAPESPNWNVNPFDTAFATTFRKHFGALRSAHHAQPHEGVLVAAIDSTGAFDAHAHLRLPSSGIAHLVLGRHERCDVVLPRDPDVSLRHLLVRATRSPGGGIRLRAIDLRSRVGLIADDGKRCEAMAADGPLFMRIGSYTLFLLPTGAGIPSWPNDADATWRLFSACPAEILPPAQPLKSRAAPTPGSVKLATITIHSSSPQAGDLTTTHAVWNDQLERGILVGRDDRCSHGGVDEGNLSRVHLVLLSVEGEVWGIDTASTNGTRVLHSQPFRQIRLNGETHLVLADTLHLRWSPIMLAVRA